MRLVIAWYADRLFSVKPEGAMPKCNECGFLAVRDEYTEEICESSEFTRSRGMHKSSSGSAVTANLFCYANSHAFPDVSGKADFKKAAAINEEVPCPQFMHWLKGRTPKEHDEMSILQKVEAATQSARAEEIRRQHEWHEEDKRLADARHRETVRTTWLISAGTLGVSSLVAIIAGVVSGPVMDWLKDWLSK
jgi:hypothetical protein